MRSTCPALGKHNALVPLDLKTSRRFDNLYFFNLLRGNGMLQSDNELVSEDPDGEVLNLVWANESNREQFFKHFAKSMIKMGNINVLTRNPSTSSSDSTSSTITSRRVTSTSRESTP